MKYEMHISFGRFTASDFRPMMDVGLPGRSVLHLGVETG